MSDKQHYQGTKPLYYQGSKEEIVQMMGYSMPYWAELEKMHREGRELNVTDLVEEIATLRAKVSFYESRIKQLNDFMHIKLEITEGP